MAHPLGIQPEGNMYLRDGPSIRESSLGALAALPDALLLDILSPSAPGGPGLGADDLGRLALASKALYCFANLEEGWKGLVLEELGGRFTWAGCWQRTYLLSTGRISPQRQEEDRRRAEQEDAEEAEAERKEKQAAEEEAELLKEQQRQEDQEEGGRSSKRRKTSAAPAAAPNGKGAAKGKKGAATAAANPAASPAAKQAEQPETNGKGAKGKGKHTKGKGKGKAAKEEGSEEAVQADEDDAVAGPGPSSTAAAAATAAANGSSALVARRQPLLRRLVLPGPLLTEDLEEDGDAATASKRPAAGASSNGTGSSSSSRLCLQRYLRVQGFYSDLLYQPWFCANFEMPADWLAVNNIDRRSGLTPEQFRTEYEIPNRPVILTDVMSGWGAMSKWSNDYFAKVFGDKDVIVGNMPIPFSTYADYAAANADEMPLYLFDKHFTQTAPALAADYVVPEQFGEDLFGLLGEGGRPDYRWLILGPARSGSSFHVDPNATSAWNALVWGAKKWVMFPPGVVPPGVHPSPDGADVATPVSLTEWFVNFYPECAEMKVKPIEFVARPGELLFVPRGWWHCALNLVDSCAITQNFVSAVGLQATLSFLKSRRPEMVSGCAQEDRCNLYDRFVGVLREQRPEVLAAVEARQEEARAKARESNKLAALFKHGPEPGASAAPACAAATTPAEAAGGGGQAATANGSSGGGFSFGFSMGGGGAAAAGGEAAGAGSGGGTGFRFGFGV